MKKIIAIVATIGMALATAPSAMAHAQLASSFPKAKAIVKIWPTTAWVEFDGNLISLPGSKVDQLTIKDSMGKQVDVKNSSVDGARLSVSLGKIANVGKITMSWRVVSEDGHPVQSSIFFYYLPTKKA